MKKYLSSLFLSSCALFISAPALAQGIYQLKNAGFEEWEDVSYNNNSGQEPKYWNSFFTGTGVYKGTAATKNQCEKSTDVRSGSSSIYSAKIFDRKVLLAIYANGNLTTGCINMGSMKASDASGNYNFTNTSDDDFNQKFTGLPDAMNVWVKYHSTKSSYHAKATTILHVAGYHQDPSSDKNKMVSAVATATDETIQPNDTWTELTIPFTYSLTDGTRPAYALVSFSTNAEPGTGTGSDYLLIDDLSYVYYHTLSALSYNGKSILEDGKTAYDLSTEAYDASKLAYTKKAKGGSVETAYDAATAQLTISVKGDNYAADNTSATAYTVQFKKDGGASDATVVSTNNYAEKLVVTINGQSTDSIPANIVVDHMSDGTVTFSLKNFYLPADESDEEAEPMYVGNITLEGVTVGQAEGYETIATDQKITIKEGTDPADAIWLGPMLGEIPVKLSGKLNDKKLYVNIDIDMQESLGQTINVVVGKESNVTGIQTVTIKTTTSLDCSAGKAEVNFSRSFKQGWNTLVLPFATTANELGAKKVATLSAGNDNTAVFHVSEDGTINANVPYVVYFDAATETTISKVVTLAATSDVQSVTPDGSALTFTGNYTAERSLYVDGTSLGYGLVNSNGKSTIRPAASGATLPATCAYFTVNTSGAATKTFSVVFEGSDVTGIDNTFSLTDGQLTPAIRGVYTLQGVKVSNGSTQGLPAGLYIVNGKKTIVR